ncbi:MAG: adaptor protein MecA [Alicyclobacillus sp.]|nr:adaptor protein MecA [Alicyclobacillus sp.]
MRVERIAHDKVRIFISYDDLEERGIDRNEIWQNGKKVQELFWDMMETAYTEVGFEIAGPIAVEAFTMPSEGVVVIVTRVPSLPGQVKSDSDEDEELDVELSAEMFSSFVFAFRDFEELVRAAHALSVYEVEAALFEYRGSYHLYVEEESLREEDYDAVWSILHEYGEYSHVTVAVLEEYGKPIIRRQAVRQLVQMFPL